MCSLMINSLAGILQTVPHTISWEPDDNDELCLKKVINIAYAELYKDPEGCRDLIKKIEHMIKTTEPKENPPSKVTVQGPDIEFLKSLDARINTDFFNVNYIYQHLKLPSEKFRGHRLKPKIEVFIARTTNGLLNHNRSNFILVPNGAGGFRLQVRNSVRMESIPIDCIKEAATILAEASMKLGKCDFQSIFWTNKSPG